MKERAGAAGMRVPRALRRAAKLTDLQDTVAAQAVKIAQLEEKQLLQHKEIMTIFGFMGDNETRLESFRALAIRKGLFTDAEYEELWDEIKGIRVKGPDELLAAGDSMRITYEIKDGDTVIAEDKGWPVRLGANALLFEEEIIGKPVAVIRDYVFEKTYPTPYPNNPVFAGKTVTFKITADKVKTKKDPTK